jgi:hypothetical protein
VRLGRLILENKRLSGLSPAILQFLAAWEKNWMLCAGQVFHLKLCRELLPQPLPPQQLESR